MRFALISFSWLGIGYAQAADLITHDNYAAPFWLPGGHLQTIYAAELEHSPAITYYRQRWNMPDGDFIDADWTELPDASNTYRPVVALFHGLEGNSQSHYAKALMAAVKARGWRGVVIHFRGCSGGPNRMPRAYYAGDTPDMEFMLSHLHSLVPEAATFAVGVSLGGNALLKWLGESQDHAGELVQKAVAVSAPMDLSATADALDHGLNRWLYTPRFVASMRPKALAMIARFPEALAHKLDVNQIKAAKTIHDIDNAVTAVLYGADNAEDYYAKNAAKPWLNQINVPTLIINALNDPFVPAASLPGADEVSSLVTLEYTKAGGHVGFTSAGNEDWLPEHILDYFNSP